MTHDQLREFAQAHAPDLAHNINKLVGQVITKGISGHLHHAAELQMRILQLEELIIQHNIPLPPPMWELETKKKGK